MDLFPNCGRVRFTGRNGLGLHDAQYVVLIDFKLVPFISSYSILSLASYCQDHQIGVLLCSLRHPLYFVNVGRDIDSPSCRLIDRTPLLKFIAFCSL